VVAEEKEEENLRFDCEFHLWRGFKKQCQMDFSSVQKPNRLDN
jgi:hypothetical protein